MPNLYKIRPQTPITINSLSPHAPYLVRYMFNEAVEQAHAPEEFVANAVSVFSAVHTTRVLDDIWNLTPTPGQGRLAHAVLDFVQFLPKAQRDTVSPEILARLDQRAIGSTISARTTNAPSAKPKKI